MNIDTMRRIDYWMGIPLCLLASAFLKLVRWIPFYVSKNSCTKSPKRVLFVELSEMGSAILADPAMCKIQKQHQAELYFVIFQKNRHSLQLLGRVPEDHCFTIRSDGLIPIIIDTLCYFRWVRTHRIDTVIDLELFSRYSALLTGLSGALRRVGFYAFHNEGLYRGEMLSHRVAYNPHQHISKNFLALVYAAGKDDDEQPFAKVHFPDESIQLSRPLIKAASQKYVDEIIVRYYCQAFENTPSIDAENCSLVLINVNGSDLLPHRRWPIEHYETIIHRILQNCPQTMILLTGAPNERDDVQKLVTRVRDVRCLNFAGGVPFAELPALYHRAKLMLTNDSGAAHFASVTNLPTYVLFGPETPSLYGALGNFYPMSAQLACSPCVSAWNHRKTACQDPVCMRSISPDQVWQEIEVTLYH